VHQQPLSFAPQVKELPHASHTEGSRRTGKTIPAKSLSFIFIYWLPLRPLSPMSIATGAA
jgi:hypothetical protein